MPGDGPQGMPLGRFQVLSLDGGGILGIFTAALLAGLEKDLGRPVLSHFDLVVGTSTGGIIAAGLGAGMTAGEIAELYISEMGLSSLGRGACGRRGSSFARSTGRTGLRRCSAGCSETGSSGRAWCRWSSRRSISARTGCTSSRPRIMNV